MFIQAVPPQPFQTFQKELSPLWLPAGKPDIWLEPTETSTWVTYGEEINSIGFYTGSGLTVGDSSDPLVVSPPSALTAAEYRFINSSVSVGKSSGPFTPASDLSSATVIAAMYQENNPSFAYVNLSLAGVGLQAKNVGDGITAIINTDAGTGDAPAVDGMGLYNQVWKVYAATFEPDGAEVKVNYYLNGSSYGSETTIGYTWASQASYTDVAVRGINDFQFGTMLRYPRVLDADEMTTVSNHLSSYYPVS